MVLSCCVGNKGRGGSEGGRCVGSCERHRQRIAIAAFCSGSAVCFPALFWEGQQEGERRARGDRGFQFSFLRKRRKSLLAAPQPKKGRDSVVCVQVGSRMQDGQKVSCFSVFFLLGVCLSFRLRCCRGCGGKNRRVGARLFVAPQHEGWKAVRLPRTQGKVHSLGSRKTVGCAGV